MGDDLRIRDDYGSQNSEKIERKIRNTIDNDLDLGNRLLIKFINIISFYKYTLAALISSIQILLIDFPIQDIAMKGWLILVVYPTIILLYALSFKVVHNLVIT